MLFSGTKMPTHTSTQFFSYAKLLRFDDVLVLLSLLTLVDTLKISRILLRIIGIYVQILLEDNVFIEKLC